MKVLYITYIDMNGKSTSGSSVRPKKMHEAFCRLGIEVKLLECQQNKRKLRRAKVKEIMEWLKKESPDICYIESPSGPIFNYIDLKLIRTLHRKKIPTGYFYRDCFWLFPEMMKEIRWWKRKIITFMNKVELPILRNNCDIIYFSSQSAIDLFSFARLKRVELLPPAADEFKLMSNSDYYHEKRVIYVGAVSKVNGTIDLIKAFSILNKEDVYNLTIVCREKEWKNIVAMFHENLNEYSWLKIEHASDEELIPLYEEASLAIIPRRSDVYIDYSIPVKLFEYIGFGKPVLSTPRKETVRIIEEEKCGIICDDSVDDMVKCIKLFFNTKELQNELKVNVQRMANHNRWIDRAQKVIDDLVYIKH